MNINAVVLTGNLTRDPETFGDGAGCKFGLAVNERFKKNDEWQERASFFDVTVFGNTGKACTEHLSKGSKVCVDGHLRQDRWTTDGGDNRSKVIVIADRVEFLGSKNGSDSDGNSGGDSAAEDEIPF